MPNKLKLTEDQRNLAAEAVSKLLISKGDAGAPVGEVKNCINSTLKLGMFPKADFGKILFVAKVKRVKDTYYLKGRGPVKERPVTNTQPQPAQTSAETEEVITLTGQLNVRVKSPRSVSTYDKVKKIIIFFVIPLVVVAGLKFFGLA